MGNLSVARPAPSNVRHDVGDLRWQAERISVMAAALIDLEYNYFDTSAKNERHQTETLKGVPLENLERRAQELAGRLGKVQRAFDGQAELGAA